MLPHSHRLPRAGFEQMTGLKRSASRHFSISYIESAPIGGFAVIVSKKVAKSSVERHQLKRRVREIIRSWAEKGRVLIVFARSGATNLPYSEIEAELTPLLRQSFSSGTM